MNVPGDVSDDRESVLCSHVVDGVAEVSTVWESDNGVWDMGYGVWGMGCGVWGMGDQWISTHSVFGQQIL